jgi:starch-binding outer membrane protein, SusD/RagB family
MKKRKIFILAGFILAVTGCSDELNQFPISQPSADNFYRNTNDFQQAVNGIYNTLSPNPGVASPFVPANNGYAIRRFEMSEVRSDNVYSPGTGVRDWNPINNFEKTLATNPYTSEAWSSNYMGISRANMVLDKLNTDAVPDEATRHQIEGEAKFLRAFFYFDLVRWFGKVPVQTTSVSISQALEIPRSPVAEVYDVIIADLKDAITLLPATPTGTNKGRATSVTAKAMLGLVYLTRTGPTYGIEGPGLQTNEFAEAVTLFNEVIASGAFGWVASYPDIFSYEKEGNPDIVFDIQAIGGNTGDVGLGARFPTEMYDGGYGNAIKLGFPGGADDDSPKAPSKSFQASFDPADTRDNFAILPSYTNLAGSLITTGMYVKFLNASKKGTDRFNWPINYPVLRYTDVLMMKAEAIIRGGFGALGTQQDVDDIVNMVQVRAGLPGNAANVTLDQLLDERRKEFMAEGLRWHDLVRNGVVLDVMAAWVANDDQAGKIKAITANDIIYPIPQTELTVSPGLYAQNPGYN